jgi:hypothetical protein
LQLHPDRFILSREGKILHCFSITIFCCNSRMGRGFYWLSKLCEWTLKLTTDYNYHYVFLMSSMCTLSFREHKARVFFSVSSYLKSLGITFEWLCLCIVQHVQIFSGFNLVASHILHL